MANPINPVSSGNINVYDSARQQDAERREREAQSHFEITGERLPEYQEHSPLVPINGYEPPNVAEDGDIYDNLGQSNHRESVHVEIGREIGRDIGREIAKAEAEAEVKEVIRKREEREKLKEESKKRFTNAISGLEVGEE